MAKLVRELPVDRCVICHSLVAAPVRDALLTEARGKMIPTVDVLGQLLALLSDHLGVAPQRKPGLAYSAQRDYFDRIDAVSFTLDHDDGAHAETLGLADVVLVGVSRVSKSVTCFYLGYRGVRAANVPLIPGFEPPEELLQMPSEKIIGLTTTPARLHDLRDSRRTALGGRALDTYCEPREINQELLYALGLMKKRNWLCLDVSYMAVEEVAVKVLEQIGRG